jgi:hypothetical protein
VAISVCVQRVQLEIASQGFARVITLHSVRNDNVRKVTYFIRKNIKMLTGFLAWIVND